MKQNTSSHAAALAFLAPFGLLAAALFFFSHKRSAPIPHAASEHRGDKARQPDDARPVADLPADDRGGFHDMLPESGIDFRMRQQLAEQFKLNLYDHGSGVAVADYDGDGDDDVLFLNQFGENGLYRNRGDGTFDNVTDQAGPLALADRLCVGAAFADYDNDGDQDLYVTSTRGGNVLLENEGSGRYQDVTERAGVGLVAHSQTPAFFDYDNDGYLDLFVTNTARWTEEDYDNEGRYYPGAGFIWTHVFNPEDREYNVLYRNNRDGTFSDVTGESGLAGKGWSGDVAVFDFDGDAAIDVLVTNMFGRSQLYRNDGYGHFDDVTRETLGKTSVGAIGAKAFDYNNDGLLDLFITDMHSDMWIGFKDSHLVEPGRKFDSIAGPKLAPDTPQREYMQILEKRFREELGLDFDHVLYGNSLFRNEKAGKFTELSDAAGMETFWPWGIAVGDFDNDRYQDVFIPSGMGLPFFYWPNSLMMNGGDGTFRDRAAQEGIEPPLGGQLIAEDRPGGNAPRSSRCAATADFDGDGRLDLIVNNFSDRPYYFQNQFPRRHYVAFRLQGTTSNRDAIGALVKLYRGDEILVQQVQCTGGYLSQSSKVLHFGLGNDATIDRVEIRWPSGTRQVIDAPAADMLHEVSEDSRAV
ncbi:MAG TPA: CRTAC1 family protein, partial [Pirellulales bacterium]|nr:CRTAC1 family protein [Pirellulales bacterium]